MLKLIDVADIIRSKNSGPFEVTFDIILKDEDTYLKIKNSNAMNKVSFAKLYGLPESSVSSIVWFDPAKAVKITIVRPHASGSVNDTDIYGAQQHAPLIGWEFEL